MAPGSTHPNGEAVGYAPGATIDPALVDPEDLLRAVSDLALVSLLVRRYAPEGCRHSMWLAFAGMWLAGGQDLEDGEELCRFVANAAHDEEADSRVKSFASTLGKIKAGVPTTGYTTLAEILGEKVARSVRAWAGKNETLPQIRPGVNIKETADQAEMALAKTGQVFANNRRLVCLGRGEAPDFLEDTEGTLLLVALQPATLLEWLSACAVWVRKEDAHMKPPHDVVEALICRGEWVHVPRLRAISAVPLILEDGRVLSTPGHDKDTGIYLDLVGLDGLQIKERPTQEDAIEAVEQIHEVFQDFPFAEECNFSAALAMLLTAFASPTTGLVP
jgi:hypothetical protein